jgi:hypothetical protein
LQTENKAFLALSDMLLYRDIISGDEMISDAFKIEEVDDFVYEVNCRLMMGKSSFYPLSTALSL